jgi:hypothetical protein
MKRISPPAWRFTGSHLAGAKLLAPATRPECFRIIAIDCG